MTAHKFPPEIRERFLEKLAVGLTVARAAAHVGIGLRTVYDWRQADEKFAAAWKDAYLIGAHALEDEAHRRAVQGTRRPVVHAGRIVTRTVYDERTGFETLEELWLRDYSDVLLCMLLKARDPETYDDAVRRAKLERKWAEEDAKNRDGNTTPGAGILEMLDRLALEKASLADHGKGNGAAAGERGTDRLVLGWVRIPSSGGK